MRRYFFDFFDGTSWRRDTCGQQLSGLQDIAAEANEALVSLAPKFFAANPNGTLCFVVRDDDHNSILRATLTLRNEILGA